MDPSRPTSCRGPRVVHAKKNYPLPLAPPSPSQGTGEWQAKGGERTRTHTQTLPFTCALWLLCLMPSPPEPPHLCPVRSLCFRVPGFKGGTKDHSTHTRIKLIVSCRGPKEPHQKNPSPAPETGPASCKKKNQSRTGLRVTSGAELGCQCLCCWLPECIRIQPSARIQHQVCNTKNLPMYTIWGRGKGRMVGGGR